jgi:peptide/nickel transport system ATP-binding protein
MYAGKIVETGPLDLVYLKPLHPYTRGLLASVLRLHKPCKKPKFIPGNPPDLRNPPSGCRFHPRCLEAESLCRDVEPQLMEVESNHYVACHKIAR